MMSRIMGIVLVVALLAGAVGSVGVAQAAPTCPGGDAPNGRGQCAGQPDGGTVCAWPAQWVKVGRVLVCVRWLAGPGM